MEPQNISYLDSLRRIITSISLPTQKNRKGSCKRCGQCCKNSNCPLLSFDSEGNARCKIYKLRPPHCSRYPRVKSEVIMPDSCGYKFE